MFVSHYDTIVAIVIIIIIIIIIILENKHLKNTCEGVQFWLKEFNEKDAACAEIVREFFVWPVKHSMK